MWSKTHQLCLHIFSQNFEIFLTTILIVDLVYFDNQRKKSYEFGESTKFLTDRQISCEAWIDEHV